MLRQEQPTCARMLLEAGGVSGGAMLIGREQMSGPKTGELTLEQKIALEIQREQERNLSLANDAVSRVDQAVRAVVETCRKTGKYQDEWVSKARDVERRFSREVRALSTQGYPSLPDDARKFNDRLRSALSAVVERCRAECALIEAGARQEIDGLKTLEGLESFASVLPNAGGSFDYFESAFLLAKARGTESSSLAENMETVSRLGVLDEAERCFDAAQDLLCDEGTTASCRSVIAFHASRLQEAVRRLGDDCRSYDELKNAIASMDPVLRELTRRARAMRDVYEDCLLEKARIEGLGGSVDELQALSSYRDEAELESVKAHLAERNAAAAKDAYIADAIDSVMEKHGYRVKKSVRFSERSRHVHHIYLQDGGEVAIHSFFSGSAIMMETGFAGRDLEIAKDGSRIARSTPRSAYARERSVEEQGRFCGLFDELGSDLAELGIHLKKTSDRPISEENAVSFAVAEGGKSADETAQESRKRSRRRETLAEREAR